jgi:hypothetical protein
MTDAPYIFISHSSRDSEQTELVANALRAAGFACWVDVNSIPDGSTWPREVEKGVHGCAIMVVIHTANSVTSDWVLGEILMAIEKKIPILVARFDDTPLPFALITRQATDLRTRRAAGLKRLVDRAGVMLASPPALTPVQQARQSADPNRHNFFMYIEQLPDGPETARVARELYTFARADADNITFSGRKVPAFHAHAEIGIGGVVMYSLRAYQKQPVIEIPLQYFTEFPPFDDAAVRLDVLHRMNALLPASARLEDARADKRPAVPLAVLKEAAPLADMKALLGHVAALLRGKSG